VYPGSGGDAVTTGSVLSGLRQVPRIPTRRFFRHAEAAAGEQQPVGTWQGGLPPRMAGATHRAGSIWQLLHSCAASAGCRDGTSAAAHAPSTAFRVRPSVKLVSVELGLLWEWDHPVGSSGTHDGQCQVTCGALLVHLQFVEEDRSSSLGPAHSPTGRLRHPAACGCSVHVYITSQLAGSAGLQQ
jgi:hypothetical protein